jgi:hypothetical protein
MCYIASRKNISNNFAKTVRKFMPEIPQIQDFGKYLKFKIDNQDLLDLDSDSEQER